MLYKKLTTWSRCAQDPESSAFSQHSIKQKGFFLLEDQPFNLKTLYKYYFCLFSNAQFWARKRYHPTKLCPTEYLALYSTSVATKTTINKYKGSLMPRQLPVSSKGDILE